MHYMSLEEMREAHRDKHTRWVSFNKVPSFTFRPRADKNSFSEEHTAPGQEFTWRHSYINTQEGWRQLAGAALRSLRECARDLTEEQFMASEFTITREGQGIQVRYLCTRTDISVESAMAMWKDPNPVLYLIIAHMEGGNSFCREFRQKDLERKSVGVPGKFDIGMTISYKASLIVRVDVQTGVSTVIKNRWGPSLEEDFRFVALQPSPPSKSVLIDNLKAEEVVHYNDGHDDARDLGILRGKADFSSPELDKRPHTWTPELDKKPHTWIVLETGLQTEPEPKASTQICKCSMLDLLSGAGHASDCPEKKR